MSTYSIYIMQLYDSIYNLMLVVWVLTVSYLFVAYMNHALLIASIPQAYGIFILNLRHSNLEATVLLTYHACYPLRKDVFIHRETNKERIGRTRDIYGFNL